MKYLIFTLLIFSVCNTSCVFSQKRQAKKQLASRNYRKALEKKRLSFFDVKYSVNNTLLCIPKKDKILNTSNLQLKKFSFWEPDCLRAFFKDNWIRLGKYEKGRIVADTLGYDQYGNYSSVIAPDGQWAVNDSVKCKTSSCLGMSLRGASTGKLIYEEERYDFIELMGRNYYENCLGQKHYFLFKNAGVYFQWYYSPKTRRLEAGYLNYNLIVIEKKVYVRIDKWHEYAVLGF